MNECRSFGLVILPIVQVPGGEYQATVSLFASQSLPHYISLHAHNPSDCGVKTSFGGIFCLVRFDLTAYIVTDIIMMYHNSENVKKIVSYVRE